MLFFGTSAGGGVRRKVRKTWEEGKGWAASAFEAFM
jgi:hypothetical protein